MPRKVRYEEMLPYEMARVVKRTPIAYLPCGTLEWHGVHMALGNDAVKAHELSLRCAQRSGGVVTPANYWAMGGMKYPWTLEPEAEGLRSRLVAPLLADIYRELEKVGFKVIITMTGHYGIGQILAVKKAALDHMYNGNAIVYAFPEFEVATDLGYHGDHAGKWETSILWALRPELVEMSQLPGDLDEPLAGVMGQDPRVHASKKLGREIVRGMVQRIATLAGRFLKYDVGKRRMFLKSCERQYEYLVWLARGMRAAQRLGPESQGLHRRYMMKVLPAFRKGGYGKVLSELDGLCEKMAAAVIEAEKQPAKGRAAAKQAR